MRLQKITFIITSFLGILAPVSTLACSLAPSSTWNIRKSDLVRSASIIVIAEVLEMIDDKASLKPNHFDYKFKVIEILKGSIDSNFVLKGFGSLNGKIEEKGSPRGFYAPDCQPHTSFTIGKKYIIFPYINNAWSWEEYHGATDKWLSEIRHNLKSVK